MDGAFGQLVGGKVKGRGHTRSSAAAGPNARAKTLRVLWESNHSTTWPYDLQERTRPGLAAVSKAFLGMAQDSDGRKGAGPGL